jgi:signal transduction histidine kinase
MTEEQIAKLFQPFFQIQSQLAKKSEGTGLGLVITKQFCNMMGGEIVVDSVYGSGSTFTLRLPFDGHLAGAVDVRTIHN